MENYIYEGLKSPQEILEETEEFSQLKFSQSDHVGNKILDLYDRPNLSADDLKSRFDFIPVAILGERKLNVLLDFLASEKCQNALKATDKSGKIIPLCGILEETISAQTLKRDANGNPEKDPSGNFILVENPLRFLRINSDRVLETSSDGINFEATGSSGHIIMADDAPFPQRSRLRFKNVSVSDDGTSTVIEGIKGDKGETGDKGDTGAKGDKGDTGSKGELGKVFLPVVDNQGNLSFVVATFSQGLVPQTVNIRGPQGMQGVQGMQGIQGEQGSRGSQGPRGIQGIKGDKGDTGSQGLKGDKGDKGDRGSQGIQGIQGEKGDQGSRGTTGAQGPQGPQGIQGNAGADGRSFVIQDVFATIGELKSTIPNGDEFAYQVSATREIFIWSELENDWISLGQIQGPVGPQGIQGVQGEQGIQGEKGEKGDQGIQGVQGEKGDRGVKGDTGSQGIQGEQGIQGNQGPPGVQGERGVQGIQGVQGKSAYSTAIEGGFTGTEADLATEIAHISQKANSADVVSNDVFAIYKENLTNGAITAGNSEKFAGKLPSFYASQEDLLALSGKSQLKDATLLAANWSGESVPFTYALSLPGVTATSVQEIFLGASATAEVVETFQTANILDGGQTTGQITLKCFGSKPAINLPIKIIMRGDM